MDAKTRLNRKILKTQDGCWVFTGSKDRYGYGWFMGAGEKKAHRASYAIHVAAVPEGMSVLHRCDVRDCVNPEHLFIGTNADNTRDCIQKGRGKFGARGVRNGMNTHPEKRSPGSKNGSAMLTEAAVLEIRVRRARGESCASLGIAFGVGPAAIGHISRRETWKHVGGPTPTREVLAAIKTRVALDATKRRMELKRLRAIEPVL